MADVLIVIQIKKIIARAAVKKSKSGKETLSTIGHTLHINNKETLSATTLLNESYFSGRFWRGNRDEYMQKSVI